VWAACSGATADYNGEGANHSAEITIRGSSRALILPIQSLHHAAASTPSHAIIGQRAKIITISSKISQSVFASSNNFEPGTFPCSNLINLKLK